MENKKTFIILVFAVLLVNFSGVFGTIFNIDSSLYAEISKSFSLSGDYLNIYVNGKEWLDKPHFPFWIAAFSMDIMGVSTLAYKLPSFVFFTIGLFYTFKLAKALYDENTAYLSVLILGSSLHIIVSNNDNRAEAILLGLIMGAVYYMYKLTYNFSVKWIVLGALFSAAAVMTKGIFVLIIIYAAIFMDFLVRKEFNSIFKLRWFWVFLLTVLFVFPEIYSVYTQFDLHPEKVVFGRNNVSGIRFFLWDSQFGRFFNNGPIKGSGDLWFFFHTLLWALAPWAIIGFLVLAIKTKELVFRVKNQEFITYFGFVIMFALFSLSKFQLSFYTNILFPFIAIMIANYILNNVKHNFEYNLFKWSVIIYTFLFIIVIGLLNYFFKPEYSFIGWIFVLIIALAMYLILNHTPFQSKFKILILGVFSSLLFSIYMNCCFYPSLMKYQSGSQIAFFINKKHPESSVKTTYNDWVLQFYSNTNLVFEDNILNLKKGNLVVIDEANLNKLKQSDISYRIIKTFEDFHVTKLNLVFLNSETRKQSVNKNYFIQID